MSLREQQSERSDGGTLEDQPESTPAIVDTEEGGDSEAQGESIGTLADPEEAIIDTVAADGAMLSTRDRIYNRLFGNGEQLARIDRFNLIRRLGTGGMGTVYEAWDEKLQRRVALKFLRKTGGDPIAEQRMFREAQGLAQLSHPNVVPVY
ncbi:MAG: protein kinase, partial [Myxococcales bacterium]|nr:protein kinase [Myxococcales bacterium]